MRQQKLFEVGLPRPITDARPTRLKRFNCNFEGIDCIDLPRLVTDAVVGEMHKFRELLITLKSTSRAFRSALEDSLQARLQLLNRHPEWREEAFQTTTAGVSCFQSISKENAVRDILRSPFPLRHADVMPLLYRKCCFCQRAFSIRGFELVSTTCLPSCRLLCHTLCLEDRVVSVRVADGSLKVKAMAPSRVGKRRRLTKVRQETQELAREMVGGLTKEQAQRLVQTDYPMRSGSGLFYFVDCHPCIPQGLLLEAAVLRSLG